MLRAKSAWLQNTTAEVDPVQSCRLSQIHILLCHTSLIVSHLPVLHPGPFSVPPAHLSGPGRLLGPAPAQHRGRQGQVSGPPEAQGLELEAPT